MAIEVVCPHCEKDLPLKEQYAGKTGACPLCKETIYVPDLAGLASTSEDSMPTEKQIEYAQKLRVAIPRSVTKDQISTLIDQGKDNAPATEKQVAFLRELGVEPPKNLTSSQVSMLIDSALNVRDQVAVKVRESVEQEFADLGHALEKTPTERLLQEIQNRGHPYVAFVLEDEEFRYEEDRPIRAALRWSGDLEKDDVLFLLLSLGKWSTQLDLEKYAEEFDEQLPSVEFNAHPNEMFDYEHKFFFGDDGLD